MLTESFPTCEPANKINVTSTPGQRYGVARSGMVPGAFTHDNTENPSLHYCKEGLT